MNKPYPRNFSHIGISVPDLEAAVKFYTQGMGWNLIMAPTDVIEADTHKGGKRTDVFGSNWGKLRIAHLSTGDGIGVELFEFSEQVNPNNEFDYWKTGVFHFCVQDANIEGLVIKIVAAGGKKRMEKPCYYYPGRKSYRMIHMEDPFGNVLEIYCPKFCAN